MICGFNSCSLGAPERKGQGQGLCIIYQCHFCSRHLLFKAPVQLCFNGTGPNHRCFYSLWISDGAAGFQTELCCCQLLFDVLCLFVFGILLQLTVFFAKIVTLQSNSASALGRALGTELSEANSVVLGFRLRRIGSKLQPGIALTVFLCHQDRGCPVLLFNFCCPSSSSAIQESAVQGPD